MSEVQSIGIYLDIPGFPGYQIGVDASVWSCRIRGGGGGLSTVWKRLKPDTNRKGYLIVGLRGGTRYKRQRVSIHQLMMLVFVGTCPKGMLVLHNDDVKLNNSINNLRYGTPLENKEDARRNDRIAHGTRNGSCKLTEDNIQEIRRLLYEGRTQQYVGDLFNISQVHVGRIKRGRNWTKLTPEVEKQDR